MVAHSDQFSILRPRRVTDGSAYSIHAATLSLGKGGGGGATICMAGALAYPTLKIAPISVEN